MWGLSDILKTSNIENVMILLNKLKPELPQTYVKYYLLQLI